jgi:hypothetical protein
MLMAATAAVADWPKAATAEQAVVPLPVVVIVVVILCRDRAEAPMEAPMVATVLATASVAMVVM